MKLKIHKKSKKIIILFLLLLMVFSSLQLFLPMLSPQEIITEEKKYEASCQPNVSYQVLINPNEVYSGTVQKEEEYYSKKLLNHVQADFELKYTGSREVPLDIEYRYYATVNGFQGKDKSKILFWRKEFPISKNIVLKQENAGTWSTKESVSFALGAYDAFAVRAKDITGMDVSSELIVSMKGKVVAHTESKDLETPFDVSIQIPLMEEVFKITKSGLDPIKGNVTVKETTQKPLDYFHIVPYAVLLCLSLFGLILVLFFSRCPTPQELLNTSISSILKNYGSRITALQAVPKTDCRQYFRVHSMKDLIKVADELQKPIFYVIDQDGSIKNHEFFVIDADHYYSVSLDSSEAGS